jgi:hypothetical protein
MVSGSTKPTALSTSKGYLTMNGVALVGFSLIRHPWKGWEGFCVYKTLCASLCQPASLYKSEKGKLLDFRADLYYPCKISPGAGILHP